MSQISRRTSSRCRASPRLACLASPLPPSPSSCDASTRKELGIEGLCIQTAAEAVVVVVVEEDGFTVSLDYSQPRGTNTDSEDTLGPPPGHNREFAKRTDAGRIFCGGDDGSSSDNDGTATNGVRCWVGWLWRVSLGVCEAAQYVLATEYQPARSSLVLCESLLAP